MKWSPISDKPKQYPVCGRFKGMHSEWGYDLIDNEGELGSFNEWLDETESHPVPTNTGEGEEMDWESEDTYQEAADKVISSLKSQLTAEREKNARVVEALKRGVDEENRSWKIMCEVNKEFEMRAPEKLAWVKHAEKVLAALQQSGSSTTLAENATVEEWCKENPPFAGPYPGSSMQTEGVELNPYTKGSKAYAKWNEARQID
jgi:hypothetical protein